MEILSDKKRFNYSPKISSILSTLETNEEITALS